MVDDARIYKNSRFFSLIDGNLAAGPFPPVPRCARSLWAIQLHPLVRTGPPTFPGASPYLIFLAPAALTATLQSIHANLNI
jgi:hypothetical protein